MTTSENLSAVFKHVPRILYLGILFCLVLSCTNKKKGTLSKSDIEKEINSESQQRKFTNEILAQETAWASALVADDLNFVASIMHNDFRLIRAYGDAPPISKDMYLGMKGMSASLAEVTSLNIATEMDSIVVARTTWTLDWEQEGVGKLPPHFDMIDIWKKNKNGIWQILSRVSQILDKPYSNK
ncbi:nuclear transport factor 2 family protein [Pareuzebyella sediminis]|uniref:nuclear transport factor 2 family protein n=1 Tax=Pareuzebyella sediminis TaxID=2607998 RepID=UPI0011EF7D31|nr:nuclear transport factor 2 family protein [Pareuzebyella sediminis]